MKAFIKILLRIIVFPAVAFIVLVGCIKLYFGYMINFLRFGGEFINYTNSNNPRTIKDVYDSISGPSAKVDMARYQHLERMYSAGYDPTRECQCGKEFIPE